MIDDRKRLYDKEYRKKHREHHRKYNREYRRNHPEKPRAYNREYHRKHPERAKRASLKWWYGITLEQFNEMAANQCFCCAICESPVPLCVDHDHATGKVRGLLCKTCNTAIGLLRDEAKLALAAASYLAKYEDNT